MGLIAQKSVTGLADLSGQFVAVNSRNSLGAILIAARLRLEGVRDYTVAEIPFANIGLAVAGRNVSAAALVEPYLTRSLRRGDGRLLDWLTGKPPLSKMAYTMLVARTGYLETAPEAVKSYLRAHRRTVARMTTHDSEARALLARSLNIHDDVARAMSLVDWPLDGRSNPALLDQVVSEMFRLRLIGSTIPATSL